MKKSTIPITEIHSVEYAMNVGLATPKIEVGLKPDVVFRWNRSAR